MAPRSRTPGEPDSIIVSLVKNHFRPAGAVAAAWALLATASAAASGPLRPVTVDDEMKFRAIVDVRIAPDGERVAYVVSTPSLSRNEHEAALYVVAASGGTPPPPCPTLQTFQAPTPQPPLPPAPPRAPPSSRAVAGVCAVPGGGGRQRTLVDRKGMNARPRCSPAGRLIAFASPDGRSEIMAPRSLAVVPSGGGPGRILPMDGAWVNDYAWASD